MSAEQENGPRDPGRETKARTPLDTADHALPEGTLQAVSVTNPLVVLLGQVVQAFTGGFVTHALSVNWSLGGGWLTLELWQTHSAGTCRKASIELAELWRQAGGPSVLPGPAEARQVGVRVRAVVANLLAELLEGHLQGDIAAAVERLEQAPAPPVSRANVVHEPDRRVGYGGGR